MANDKAVAGPTVSDLQEQVDFRDARIKELEGLLKSVEETHAFQADRAEKLEAQVKALSEKHSFQKKRADRLESDVAKLAKRQAEDETVAKANSADHVVFDGKTYPVIGDFRADNTFAEVKRGHCPEGVTLIAIDRPH